MKEFLKFQEDDSTVILNQWLNGILPSGVYCGFDASAFEADMILRLNQNNAPEHIDTNGNQSKVGVIRTKQGVVLAENQSIDFNIEPTSTQPRIDVIYIQYQYQQISNPPLPFYSLIKGTPASVPTAPDLTTPAIQIKIGEIHLPASCTALNQSGVRWVKEKSPIIYNLKKSLVVCQTNNLFVNASQILYFTNFTKTYDELNELDAATGIFTAKEDGWYKVSFNVRFDFESNDGAIWAAMGRIEKYQISNAAWSLLEGGFTNLNQNGQFQSNRLVSCLTYLLKGERLRFGIDNYGDSPLNSYLNNIYIEKFRE